MCSTIVDWKSLESEFGEINRQFINLDKTEKRLLTEHFNKVYKHVTDRMGEIDPFFTKVFQGQQLAGSYADRIKVGQPDEYDALMILNFPDPVVEKSRPGFVKINVRDGISKKWSTVDKKNYKALIDEDGYLLQDEVLSWLRGLIYKEMERCEKVIRIGQTEYSVVECFSSGPAVTLALEIIKCEHGTKGSFSIDFVGALAFDFHKKWFADFEPQFLTAKKWNAIAKPNNANQNPNREWACSYADMEREYLRDTQTLKQLIRVFKKIRDRLELTNLKSYYIKVVFLHQRKKQNNDYWKQSLGTLFGEMFDIILSHVETRQLLSFWHNEYNLFGELEPAQATDIYNKLKSIKKKIVKHLANKNPELAIFEILTTKEVEQVKRMRSSASQISASATTSDEVIENSKSKNCEIS